MTPIIANIKEKYLQSNYLSGQEHETSSTTRRHFVHCNPNRKYIKRQLNSENDFDSGFKRLEFSLIIINKTFYVTCHLLF